MSELKKFLDEAVQNIRADRAACNAILTDAMIYLKKNEEHHKNVGIVVAKYLETLQRSNEQLVKVVSLLNKQEKERNVELDDFDRENIFEEIRKVDENKEEQ